MGAAPCRFQTARRYSTYVLPSIYSQRLCNLENCNADNLMILFLTEDPDAPAKCTCGNLRNCDGRTYGAAETIFLSPSVTNGAAGINVERRSH